MDIYQKLIKLLTKHHISFQEYQHPPEGKTEIISQIRGNRLEQAAKAMVLKLQYAGSTDYRYALAIVTGDCKINLKSIAKYTGAKKVSFASAETAEFLTGCQIGAVPPFIFKEDIKLLVDNRISTVGQIFFNAGALDKSLSISVNDYFTLIGDVDKLDMSIS